MAHAMCGCLDRSRAPAVAGSDLDLVVDFDFDVDVGRSPMDHGELMLDLEATLGCQADVVSARASVSGFVSGPCRRVGAVRADRDCLLDIRGPSWPTATLISEARGSCPVRRRGTWRKHACLGDPA